MDNQEEINNEAEIDKSYLNVNFEINDNIQPCQFEPLPRARRQPQGGGSGTSSSEESEGEEDVNKDRIRNTTW